MMGGYFKEEEAALGTEDFEISFKTCAANTGKCFNCYDTIDQLDGEKYIEVSLPKQTKLKFHYGCYKYFLDGLNKFREIFMNEESSVSRDEYGFKRDGSVQMH